MMRLLITCATLAILFLSACAKQDSFPTAGAPQATVLMRDGTRVTGQLLSSSATEVRLSGDDNVTRTIPMTQVRSIDYGVAAAADSEPVHEYHPHPVESAITTKSYELPVGAEVPVRTEETIDSGKTAEGQTYAAEVTRDIRDANGDVVIPRGSNAQIVIRSASQGGRIRGASDLVLDLGSVSIDGRAYRVSTAEIVRRGKSNIGANKRTAEYTGGGAALGAIIGAIAGGGKGAGIGAASGAGAGAITQIVTKGSIKVPVETVLTFKLDRPLRIMPR